jgi:hypothetical protein
MVAIDGIALLWYDCGIWEIFPEEEHSMNISDAIALASGCQWCATMGIWQCFDLRSERHVYSADYT